MAGSAYVALGSLSTPTASSGWVRMASSRTVAGNDRRGVAAHHPGGRGGQRNVHHRLVSAPLRGLQRVEAHPDRLADDAQRLLLQAIDEPVIRGERATGCVVPPGRLDEGHTVAAAVEVLPQ